MRTQRHVLCGGGTCARQFAVLVDDGLTADGREHHGHVELGPERLNREIPGFDAFQNLRLETPAVERRLVVRGGPLAASRPVYITERAVVHRVQRRGLELVELNRHLRCRPCQPVQIDLRDAAPPTGVHGVLVITHTIPPSWTV